MKTEVKTAWQDALKSGNFTQGNGQLRTWDSSNQRWKYCCLGVLCEISGLGEWEVRDAHGLRTHTYLGQNHYLPVEVAEWAGIDTDNESSDSIQQILGMMNDEGKSFPAIADFIGQEL